MLRNQKKSIFPFLLFYCIIFLSQDLLFACDICGIGGFGGTQGGLRGQSIASPETVGKNRLSLGFLFEYQDWKDNDPQKAHEQHEEGRDSHSRIKDKIYSLVLGYGVTNNFSVTLQIPYVERRTRQVEEHDFLGQRERSEGMGDTLVFGKYRFYNKLFGATAIFGIKTPSGEVDQRDKIGSRFEPEEQPGTGSIDWIFGVALNKRIGHFTFDGSIIYQLKGSGSQDYEFGDIIRANAQGAYTLKERGRYPGVDLLAGVNAQFAEKDHENSEKISDTGGTIIFFSPGISSNITENLNTSVSVLVPILQNRGRDHQEMDYEVLFSLGYTF